MTTVYFYYSFPTNYKNGTGTVISSSSHPCSSDIEYECIKSNKYTNWEIGSASCTFLERCLNGTRCCNTGCPISGCNKTCKTESKTGISCKGYNPSTCGCSGSWGSNPVTRSCKYTCYTPPTDVFCYPGAVSTTYVSGRKDLSSSAYYVFKATYNTSTFTTPAQIKKLEDNLNENDLGLSSTLIQSNNEQLTILKKKVCATTAANLLLDPCTDYCKVTQKSGELPTTNCPTAWTNFCSYSNNIASTECGQYCSVTSDGSSNCKSIYHTYCNNPTNFSKTVCRDFYKTQYINNQLSDPVLSILKTQCSKYADTNGNVIDSTGALVVPGLLNDKYPATTCACFLPDNVYSTFYDKTTSSNPDLRQFMTINQCSYPDCANASAIQPQKLTCPNVAITSCIVNNTIGGNVTNSNFNIVNECITQVESTGTYENKNTNIAPTEPPVAARGEKVVAQIPPTEFEFEETPLPTILPKQEEPISLNQYYRMIAVLAVVLLFLTIATIFFLKESIETGLNIVNILLTVILLILTSVVAYYLSTYVRLIL